MLRSARFWIPFATSLLIGVGIAFLVLAGMGTHHRAGPGEQSLGLFLFPYVNILFSLLGLLHFVGLQISVLEIVLVILLLPGQFPIYGILLGYANYHNRVKPMIWTLVAIHVFAYFVASSLLYLSN